MITIDHCITAQLWDDRYFWELVPWAEPYREAAEEALVKVDVEQSSLSLKRASVYNQWKLDLVERAKNDTDSLDLLAEYIHHRRRRKETIQIQDKNKHIVIWNRANNEYTTN